MTETFEQGWMARPFKEQFPELDDDVAKRLDNFNHGIFDLLIAGLLTDSQAHQIRTKKFPRIVTKEIVKARKKKTNPS